MKARSEYELVVRRGGRAPALLADPERVDSIEVLEIASGEVVLFWDTLPAQTGRLARALRTGLVQLEAAAFLAKWRRYEQV